MEQNNIQYYARQTRIHKDVYRPSGLTRFVRSIISILLVGHSPIEHRPDYARRLHK